MNKQIYRLITVAAFVISATASIVNSALIEEVEIEGNINVSDKEISDVISAEAGLEFKSSLLSEDISAIFGMGKFEDVAVFTEEISTDSVKVIYEVVEKPVISKIVFKGNENIKAKTLAKELEARKEDFFDDSTLEYDRKKIEQYYRDKGYVRCTVEAYFNQTNQDKVEVTYFIEEGNKITVADIKIIGVAGESYKKVYKLLETKEGKVLKQDQLQEDLTKIEEYYKNSGYINVRISDPLITYGPEDKNVYLTIFINEDKKYKIGSVDISGYENIDRENILNNISVKEGTIYSQKAVEKDIASIQELYGRKGYIQVQIRPEFSFDREENKVDIQYNISEGPKVFVNNIFINGNFVTKEYVIRRHLQISEGDPFDISKVRSSQRQIFQLGFFRDVQINILPTEIQNNMDLVFKVEEQKTGTASIGAGYSTQDKLVGTVQVSQDNLFGRGQKLSLMWEFGREKQNYRIDFDEPYLFNTPTPFSVSAYNTIRTRYYQEKDYTENRAGGSLSLGRHFTKDFSGYLKYTLEQVKVEKVSPSIRDELSEESDTTSGVTPMLIYDSRDYPFDPSTGIYLRGSNQFAGGIFGGTQDFLKFESKSTYFKPVWKRLVGVLNLETGIVAEYGDTEEVPVYERFDVGGAESVRGYESWGDIGAPEGGKYKMVINAELKFPIFSEKGQTILQGAFFYDVGSSWTDFENITLQSGTGRDNLRRGVGLGIRFKTRAFPIRLDWGYGIDKRPKEWSWYFTLGDIF